MAIPKKGSRRIVVDGTEYLWRVPRRPASGAWDGNTGFRVSVQRSDRRGSVLTLRVQERHPAVARVFGSRVVKILPSDIAAAIRQALASGWRPDEPGRDFAVDLPR